jgi:hypothetical protein
LSKLIEDETLERDRSVLNFIELAVNQYPLFHEDEFLTLRGSTAVMLKGAEHGLPDITIDRAGTKYVSAGVRKSATLIEGHKNEASDPKQRSIALLLEGKLFWVSSLFIPPRFSQALSVPLHSFVDQIHQRQPGNYRFVRRFHSRSVVSRSFDHFDSYLQEAAVDCALSRRQGAQD